MNATTQQQNQLEWNAERLQEGGEGTGELWGRRHRVPGAPKGEGERETEEVFEEIGLRFFQL